MTTAAESLVGAEAELDVGPVAHGGHCVARWDGRVVFVRHTLPGERVRVRVTEGDTASRFLRADAVDVLEPAPARVEPPCPYAGPGRCGGCDFQHVAPQAQRAAARRGGRRAAAAAGRPRRRGPRSNRCRPTTSAGAPGWAGRWATTAGSGCAGTARTRSRRSTAAGSRTRRSRCRPTRRPARAASTSPGPPPGSGPCSPTAAGWTDLPHLVEEVRGRAMRVSGSGFWQVHPAAARTLVDAVLALGAPRSGERALDLYAGVGLFSAFLGDAVGADGSVVLVEGDARRAARRPPQPARQPAGADRAGPGRPGAVDRAVR